LSIFNIVCASRTKVDADETSTNQKENEQAAKQQRRETAVDVDKISDKLTENLRKKSLFMTL
jgi:hypothetical protein